MNLTVISKNDQQHCESRGRSYNPVVAQMLRQHQKKEEELREKEGHLRSMTENLDREVQIFQKERELENAIAEVAEKAAARSTTCASST